MNIKPEFRTSIEWKKYKQKLEHPAAMEFLVNLGCEVEGITRQKKQDTGHLGTNNSADLLLMAGAELYDIEAARLEDSLLTSGLMTTDDEGYRLIFWEEHNTNLIANRQNGRKGGRKKKDTESNSNESTQSNTIEDNKNEDKERESNHNVRETKATESNLSERNITGGLSQEEPTDNQGSSFDEASKKMLDVWRAESEY